MSKSLARENRARSPSKPLRPSTETDPQLFGVHLMTASFLTQHIGSHCTGAHHWPADAVFAVKYNLSTWPLGWMKEAHMEFFTSLEEFETWRSAKHEWARCEDNHVAFVVYEWDLGPQLRGDLSHDPGSVGLTHAEMNASALSL